MRFGKQLLFAIAVSFFVVQACNKDNTLNQSEVGIVSNKPIEGARFCASHEYNEALMASDPMFRANQQSIEEFTTRFVSLNPDLKTRVVVTIPVVVHVVYRTAAENISDGKTATAPNAIAHNIVITNKAISTGKKNLFCLSTGSYWM